MKRIGELRQSGISRDAVRASAVSDRFIGADSLELNPGDWGTDQLFPESSSVFN